jgi:hypothetical protein
MIGPERAFELALIELLTFYWPTDLSACPAMRAGRDDREEGNEDSETTAAVLVVECVKVDRQPGNSGALLGEADVFVQADVADLSQAQVDVLTGALSAAVQAVEEGLSVAVAAGRDYPAFVLETYGQVELMKHGPEAEDPAGGRMRRDGVKVMLGFGLVVGDGVEGVPVTAPWPADPSVEKEIDSVVNDVLAAEGLSSNCLVHVRMDGQVERADGPGGKEAHGLVRAAASPGAAVAMRMEGLVNGFTGLTKGAPVFLGAAGQLTQTVPVTGLQQAVGVAVKVDQIYLEIELPVVL